jgi:hypothetical protein
MPGHGNRTSCSFIPPPGTTDFYLIDHYDQAASGSNLTAETGGNAGQWNSWLSGVHASVELPVAPQRLRRAGLQVQQLGRHHLVASRRNAERRRLTR